MNEADVSAKLRVALVAGGAVCWKVSDRFHASRPDLIMFHRTKCVAIEVKVYPAMPTAMQKFSLTELGNQGIPVFILSYNKVTKTLRLLNLWHDETLQFLNMKDVAEWLLRLSC